MFTLATSKHALERQQRSIAALLAKFRIPSSDVFVIPDITRRPTDATFALFDPPISVSSPIAKVVIFCSKHRFSEIIKPFLVEDSMDDDIDDNKYVS